MDEIAGRPRSGDDPRPGADAPAGVVPAGDARPSDIVIRPIEPPPSTQTFVRSIEATPAHDQAGGTLVRPVTPTAGEDRVGESRAGDDRVDVRLGPGPSGAGPSSPGWTATAQPGPRGRRRPIVLAVVTAAACLGVGIAAFSLLSTPGPLRVMGVSVTAAEPGPACDATVEVVGTIRTDAGAGTVTYRWLRSDGTSTDTLTQAVTEGAAAVDVRLLWTVSGPGRYPATATLQVIEPDPVEATATFTYDCS